MQLPETIFGIPLTADEEPASSRLPRTFTREFRFLRAKLAGEGAPEFDIVASDRRIDVKKAAAAAETVSSITDLDATVCSPALDWWQMRALAERGVPFIRDERNLWMPFLGASVKMDVSATAPRQLSPQAQRVFTNLLCGAWDGKDAGELATLAGKSPSSVSKYLAELSAVCPQFIERLGRRRLLTSAGIGKDELLERFDGYLSSPVARSFPARVIGDAATLGKAGFLMSGEPALQLKTDLAYDGGPKVIAATNSLIDEAMRAGIMEKTESPWDADATVQVLAYGVDFPDNRFKDQVGLPLVDDLTLYLAMRGAAGDDPRLADAIEQVRSSACHS